MSVILLILLVFFIFLIFTNSKQEKSQPKACKVHKWVWEKQPGDDEVEYLRCSVCNKLPSEAANE